MMNWGLEDNKYIVLKDLCVLGGSFFDNGLALGVLSRKVTSQNSKLGLTLFILNIQNPRNMAGLGKGVRS
jgi:hypothetical protein